MTTSSGLDYGRGTKLIIFTVIYLFSALTGALTFYVLFIHIMSFNFDSLYQAYVTETCEFYDLTPDQVPVSEFLTHTLGSINSCVQDGIDPNEQDLKIIEYAQQNGLTDSGD